MIHIKFKNLEKSEIARDAALDRLQILIEKFPDLQNCKIQVTLEMENSPTQAGPDLFRVKLHILSGRYENVTVDKADSNLYKALADVAEHMLETLNRFGDKTRVKQRAQARKFRAISNKQEISNE